MANLRRASARRSYRSMASNRFVSFDRTVANLAGPSSAVVRKFSMKAGSGPSASLGVSNCSMSLTFNRVSARDYNGNGRPTRRKGIAGAHNVCGANRSALLLREFFGFSGLRSVQDVGHVQRGWPKFH